jgi:hypothetical protein
MHSPLLRIFGATSLVWPSKATTVFSDTFNTENGGIAGPGSLNYNAFAKWSVSSGLAR